MKVRPLLLCILLMVLMQGYLLTAQEIKPHEVKRIMKKVADWQINHFHDTYSGNKDPHNPKAWPNGALYIGMLKWAMVSDEDKYFQWLKEIGNTNKWKLHDRIYHADDHTVGQLYLSLYQKYKEKKMLKPTKRQFDYVLLHPAKTSLEWASAYHQDRWNWCDALFMSPPVWAKLYNLTGDDKYLNFLMSEFKATTSFLFDDEESLFYRDESYMEKRDHGTKIFWSRGNGWVFAGLVNVMNELKKETKEYKYFLRIYKKMAKKLIQIQTPEGHWPMSLLGEEFYPTPETSGTSFHIYGLAWGVNNQILDRSIYEPFLIKGWNSLVDHITDDGMLGYVQPIGAAPGEAFADQTEVYGTGAFLCAGTEIYKLYAQP
ncbi:glycoside hydrolase family 88 protein [Flagellimonas hymeniacidonis]|uniref:Glycoside hydrolase family 88 protein n=1 Tax=Flagellimonas hymeniacidonis TaxID=2603628 RepID=A0A5C8V7E4_9FLAO|nr:glycoside hydrolase family 88 protein [Flagellimonas hymeniacidonis]TXN37622.1 glycoside hydrolase family 88 protein [Flagellimonas hymeniacidonis]